MRAPLLTKAPTGAAHAPARGQAASKVTPSFAEELTTAQRQLTRPPTPSADDTPEAQPHGLVEATTPIAPPSTARSASTTHLGGHQPALSPSLGLSEATLLGAALHQGALPEAGPVGHGGSTAPRADVSPRADTTLAPVRSPAPGGVRASSPARQTASLGAPAQPTVGGALRFGTAAHAEGSDAATPKATEPAHPSVQLAPSAGTHAGAPTTAGHPEVARPTVQVAAYQEQQQRGEVSQPVGARAPAARRTWARAETSVEPTRTGSVEPAAAPRSAPAPHQPAEPSRTSTASQPSKALPPSPASARTTISREPSASGEAPASSSPVPARPARRPAGLEEAALLQRAMATPGNDPASPIGTGASNLKAQTHAAVDAAKAKAVGLKGETLQQTQRVSAPARVVEAAAPEAKRRAAEREARVETVDAPAASPAPKPPAPAHVEAPRPTAEATPVAPPPHLPIVVAPALAEDPSLRVAINPGHARVSIDTGEGGQLSVQVKVKDGVAQVQASGPAAPMVEARQLDLRVALAQEGLALGNFDLTQSDARGQREPEPSDRDASPRRSTGRSTSSETGTVSSANGRLHVKA